MASFQSSTTFSSNIPNFYDALFGALPEEGTHQSTAMTVVKRKRAIRRRVVRHCSKNIYIKSKSVSSIANNVRARRHRMQTRSGRVEGIRNAVFDTTELLEQVLKHTDIDTFLQCRQVCKLWYWTIHKSPTLIKKLTWASDTKPLAWILDNHTGILRTYKRGDEKAYDAAWFRRQGVCLPAHLNPLCLKRDPESVLGNVLLRQRFRRAESLKFVRQPDFCGCTCTINQKLASMHVSDPPAREVVVYLHYKVYDINGSLRYKNKELRAQVKNKNGVTWQYLLQDIRMQLSPFDRWAASEHRLVVDIAKSDVWAVGVVFYNDAEWDSVHDGKLAIATDANNMNS